MHWDQAGRLRYSCQAGRLSYGAKDVHRFAMLVERGVLQNSYAFYPPV